ncbi:hypothetical protein NCC49_003324 [Naganishia albida]|nr:hypothetical protein NCC49_003324 [Naganishia albida]
MFTTIFNRSSPVFRRQAPAAIRGLRTTPVVRSSQGYGDPGKNDQPVSHEAADAQAPTPQGSGSGNSSSKSTPSSKGSSSSSSGSGSTAAESKDNASHADSSGEAVSQAPKGKQSTQGTQHGAQGNGPDPQAEDHMGSQGGGGKPPSQQETKKVGEKPKSA